MKYEQLGSLGCAKFSTKKRNREHAAIFPRPRSFLFFDFILYPQFVFSISFSFLFLCQCKFVKITYIPTQVYLLFVVNVKMAIFLFHFITLLDLLFFLNTRKRKMTLSTFSLTFPSLSFRSHSVNSLHLQKFLLTIYDPRSFTIAKGLLLFSWLSFQRLSVRRECLLFYQSSALLSCIVKLPVVSRDDSPVSSLAGLCRNLFAFGIRKLFQFDPVHKIDTWRFTTDLPTLQKLYFRYNIFIIKSLL